MLTVPFLLSSFLQGVSEEQFSRVLGELEQQQYIKVSGKRGLRVIKKLTTGQDRE